MKLLKTALIIGSLTLSGCGGGGGGVDAPDAPIATTPPSEPPSGLWIKSSTGEGLAAYREKLTTKASAERALAFADGAPAQESAGTGYSTTYALEPTTDEYDIVKYDGSTLAIAPSRSGCCYIVEDSALPATDALIPPEPSTADARIRLFQTDPGAGGGTFLTSIGLEEGYRTEGMYLFDNYLQVLLSTAWWGAFGARHSEPGYWEANEIRLETYDLSNPAQPDIREQWSV